ncbi:MAG: universal stress protein [Gammaproteobacteria bacterium]
MTEFSKILIVLDVYKDFHDNPEHLPLEVHKALEMILHPDSARIHLVGCGFEEYLHDSYSDFGPDAIAHRKQFIAEMESRLDVFAQAIKNKGYSVDCRVHWTYPRYEQIAREAEELDVDLVVQHAHMRMPHEKHNLSHDSWQLIKTCRKPLLLTKDKEWLDQPVILAAVDPVHSHHKKEGLDYRILDYALQTQKATGGAVHVIHAFSESARPFAKADTIKKTHADALELLLEGYDFLETCVHLVDETPMNAIVHTQDKLQADITVTGALSRSRLAEMIIGNTASRVLDYLKSDLLIIHPQ